MATVRKLKITRWYVADPSHPKGRRETKPHTPGAEKVVEEGATYFVVWKENGKTKREATGCTDKRAAQRYLDRWNTARERGDVGLADPYKQHLDRPAREHVTDHIEAVRFRGRSEEYVSKLEREMNNILTGAGVCRIRDLTVERVADYLSGLKVKSTTRNKHRSYLFSFCEWLVKRDRLPANPILKVETVKRLEAKRQRRSLKPGELRVLVRSVAGYPLSARSTNKGGRPRKDGSRPAPSAANLSDATRAVLQLQGRERQLWYRVALLTGLRRAELSRVRVRHFRVKRSLIDLPGELTKNRKRAVIPLPRTLATDLERWVADTRRPPDGSLFDLPDAATVCVMHKRHLAFAGLPYQTDRGFADWHSLRMSANTYLRRRGVSLRLRQRFLRHAAADLATAAYDDERLAELRPVVELLRRLDAFVSAASDRVE